MRVITDNIAMWEIQHGTVDWDNSMTQTVLATLKTQNRLLCEFCVSLAVIHLFPYVGFVRNKLQCYTFLLNPTLLPQVQVCAWMVYPLQISGIWFLKYYILP